MNMKIVDAVLANGNIPLPPIQAVGYEYVVAGNGLFVRAENPHMRAMVQVSCSQLRGLAVLRPCFELKIPHAPVGILRAALRDARESLPNEAMYQLVFDGGWRCIRPRQCASRAALEFDDTPTAVIDLHSHGQMDAFFSSVDDGDECGLRVYAVLGNVGSARVKLVMRAGVYGHYMPLEMTDVFDGMVEGVWIS